MNSIQKFDIDIGDEAGRVCARLRGFTSRVLTSELPLARSLTDSSVQIEQVDDEASAETSLSDAVLLMPHWEAMVPPMSASGSGADSTVLLAGGTQGQQQLWREHYPQLHVLSMQGDTSVEAMAEGVHAVGRVEHVVWLSPVGVASSITDEGIITGQAAGVVGLYRLIKALLSQGYGTRTLKVSVLTWQTQAISRSERIDPTHASVHGLVGSLAKEYADWEIRLVDLPIESNIDQAPLLLNEVLRLPTDPQGNAWVYRAGEWYRQQLVPCELPVPQTSAYRQGGVYVVIGGAGGLGEVFSEHLIKHYQAQMVWIGRREADADIEAKIDRLSQLGPAPTYISADATDRESLDSAYQKIKEQHGQIHGVVQAAIALLDKSLAMMDEARFKAGLEAKVDVSVRMAQVFSHESLDFLLFFSSLQSFSKAAGQSNYAAGCTFKDAFAQQLAQDWTCPVKIMNWGYWGSVGIVASQAYRVKLAQQGIGSIEPEEGMAALEQLLCVPAMQLAFIKTTLPRGLSAMTDGMHERFTREDERQPSLPEHISKRIGQVVALEE
jgi:NADP-dependent 3-hydroxy acid dehydrogenase YdfG